MVDQPLQRRNSELVLPPNTYAYVLDSTKGKVSAFVGPYKNSLSETDQLVTWDSRTQQYSQVADTEAAKQVWALAGEGQYIVLTNPAPEGSGAHPPKGTATEAAELQVGRRVIVPGPTTFPLWPGQAAQTIEGHHLRHNQYVVVRVYDADQARENWQSAVIAPQTSTVEDPEKTAEYDRLIADGMSDAEAREEVWPATTTTTLAPEPTADREFTMGQLIVIPGVQVSFYMPSTGMEVVPEVDSTNTLDQRSLAPATGDNLRYVRDAVTLETLEYCILLDENGTKRYVRGPAVVFPNPTETFKTNDNSSRVFDAIELNEQSGLYIKVIEEYTDEDGLHPVGQELFITGSDQAIYFPRAEHSIITYGGKRKHHSIAVPAGEARYVLDRRTGVVRTDRGPTMLLPDPRHEVIVRRILDPHDVQTMFPGNVEALAINQSYAAQRAQDSQDYLENAEMRKSLRPDRGGRSSFAGNEQPVIAAATSSMGEAFMEDTITRQTSYTPPRTITLDTKYEGAVAVAPFPGYAIMVTDKLGNRRVEMGPQVVLLEYGETVMALSLSTGRPKNDDKLLRTGYLRVVNNVVSDLVTVETQDLVPIQIELSYRVNFEGTSAAQRQKWFDVENYVQVLTDHCRSRLRNIAKRHDIRSFYENTIDIIRDTLLGQASETEGRVGLIFPENGMRVYDVEVLSVEIQSENVARLLGEAQNKALTGAIQLQVAEDTTTRDKRLEELKRDQMQQTQITAEAAAAIALAEVNRDLEHDLLEAHSGLRVQTEQQKIDDAELAAVRVRVEQAIALEREQNEVAIERLVAETTEGIRRMAALGDPLITAMQSLTDHALMEKIVTAIGPVAMASGLTSADLLERMFAGTPLGPIAGAFAERPFAIPSATPRG